MMKSFLNHLKLHYGLIIFLIILGTVLCYKVVSHPTPFYDWDESIYVQVGKEMVAHHSLLPTLQGQPWLEKPFLAPLFYGLVQLIPANPEITTRVASVLLSLVAFALLYAWSLRITKNRFFSLVFVVIAAFNPLMLERAQIVNTDVFLLIGWLGYFLFYKNFWKGLLFLSVGVLSKSLLGFYPALLVIAYEALEYFLNKKNSKKELLTALRNAAIQTAILSFWYICMFAIFKGSFVQVHFSDHLLKRVTKSIESHFGQRTFYIDIIVAQYGWYLITIAATVVILVFEYCKKKISLFQFLLAFSLIPWFIFLNLTKTKIEWYIYPAVPGIIFLMLYPLTVLKQNKWLFYAVLSVFTLFFLLANASTELGKYYSNYDDNYHLTVAARSECSSLNVLVSATERQDHATLSKDGLLISTSDIYGNHPARIYYFGKPVTPFYTTLSFQKAKEMLPINSCVSIDEYDYSNGILKLDHFKYIGSFGHLRLFKRV